MHITQQPTPGVPSNFILENFNIRHGAISAENILNNDVEKNEIYFTFRTLPRFNF
jgi:hypothetical protein